MNTNELDRLFSEDHKESFLGEMIGSIPILPHRVPQLMATPLSKLEDEPLAEDLRREPGKLHIVPDSFRRKLDKLAEPLPEKKVQEMYIYYENLRRKHLPKGVIRNAIKREFGIVEYDS